MQMLLLYVFYGSFYRVTKGKASGRPAPVFRALHKQIIQGRHRFKKHVETCFEDLLTYFDDDLDRVDYLCDAGVNEVPNEYLALVEKGFRAFHIHIFAMRQSVMKSRKAWHGVAKWRKREAYIVMARFVLQRENYNQWDCFKWQDFEERELMSRTFTVRHWPLTNGDKQHDRFDGYIKDPKSWDMKAKGKKAKKFVPTRAIGARNDEPQCDSVMVWDMEKHMLVPLV